MLVQDVSVQDVPEGCRSLVVALDRAVGGVGSQKITKSVGNVLCELIEARAIALPENLAEPVGESYARRLIHRDEKLGYSVLAMVWGPGQGTPVHDHDGLWCVEGVLQGRLEITPYALIEQRGEPESERYRLLPQGSVDAGFGSVGRLIPPFEYHTVANPSARDVAITVHVYGGELDRCSTFVPVGDDWYRRERRELTYTAT